MIEKAKSWILAHRSRYEIAQAEREWRGLDEVLDAAASGSRIASAIRNETPFLTGKVGANEQVLLRWAMDVPVRTFLYKRRTTFHNTRFMLTNAGLRPRTEASYLEFGDRLAGSVGICDLLGVWRNLGEMDLYRRCGFRGETCGFFDLDPWFMDEPWSRALVGKRVFVVSPFLRLFAAQLAHRSAIWAGKEVLPEIELSGFEFPYLIDPGNTLEWQQVWRAVISEMERVNPDVVLTGCGALGLPLAAEAKKQGRVGIHLGGMLQILFGVRGKRYDDAENYSSLMNGAWIRPPEDFRPAGFRSVEDGCYW